MFIDLERFFAALGIQAYGPSSCKPTSKNPVVIRLLSTMSSLPTNRVSHHVPHCSSSVSRLQPAAAVPARAAEALQAHNCETFVDEGARTTFAKTEPAVGPGAQPSAPEPASVMALRQPPPSLPIKALSKPSAAAASACSASPATASLSLAQVGFQREFRLSDARWGLGY